MNRFDIDAPNWDQPRRLQRTQNLAAAIREELGDEPGSAGRGLEYGCGTGALGLELRNLFESLILVDSSAGMINQAQMKLEALGAPQIRALQWDLAEVPLRGVEVDTVITVLALHHIRSLRAVLARFRSLMPEGGRLLIIDMDEDGGAWHQHQEEFDGHHGFNREDLERWLEEDGFQVRSVKTIHSMTRTIDEKAHRVPLFLMDAQAV